MNDSNALVLQNKAIKLYEESTSLDSLSSMMMNIEPEQRLVVFDTLGTMVRDLYPTMIDRDHYLATRPPEKIVEDFNIKHTGEIVGYDDEGFPILGPGGLGVEYRDNVQKGVTFLAWKWFWLDYSKYEAKGQLYPDGLPDFEWNIRRIEYYIFNCLDPNAAKKYLSALLWKVNGMNEIPADFKKGIIDGLEIISQRIMNVLKLFKE
jgi:hypothetical protein